jgi:hypothetical protein
MRRKVKKTPVKNRAGTSIIVGKCFDFAACGEERLGLSVIRSLLARAVRLILNINCRVPVEEF